MPIFGNDWYSTFLEEAFTKYDIWHRWEVALKSAEGEAVQPKLVKKRG